MRRDDADTQRLFIGSEPLDDVHDRRAASRDTDKKDSLLGDKGDDDAGDTDSDDTDSDTTDTGDTGDDSRDSDTKD